MFVYYYYYINNYYYAISKALSSPSPPLTHVYIFTHIYIQAYIHTHTHTHGNKKQWRSYKTSRYTLEYTRISTCSRKTNLFTKKEMHASYTVISMISTFAMYLYIYYIPYTYIIISIMPLSWTACLINVARYLWMRILSGCLLNISLYTLRLNF